MTSTRMGRNGRIQGLQGAPNFCPLLLTEKATSLQAPPKTDFPQPSIISIQLNLKPFRKRRKPRSSSKSGTTAQPEDGTGCLKSGMCPETLQVGPQPRPGNPERQRSAHTHPENLRAKGWLRGLPRGVRRGVSGHAC